ncbi:MAG: DUF3575 domain-containing protein [Bacteroidetes bacterium]|nr:DUF3575 domain-containing protein [Bacteroidota bacterium]
MKKALIIIVILTSSAIKAQTNDVSINVLNFIISTYEVGFEHGFGEKQSVGLNVNFTNKNMFESGGKKYSEFNIIPTYKYFTSPEKGADGFYLGVYGRYRSSSSKDNEFIAYNPTTFVLTNEKTDVTSSTIALGALTGYKWVANNGFFVEPEIGIGKAIVNSITVSNKNAEENNMDKNWNRNDYLPVLGNKIGLDLRIAFKIGKRF